MNAQDEDGIALLCRCLASVSMADGDVDGREIATMITMVEQVTGTLVSADDFVTATIDVSEDKQAFNRELESLTNGLDTDFKALILKTCIMIGRADDDMMEAEKQEIYILGSLLGFSEAEIARQFDIIS